MTKDNLFVLRDFIQKRTGLFFPESNFFAIEELVHSNYQNSSFTNFNNYILYLHSKSGENHLKKLISLLTTNETFFFRGKPHFNLLEKHILPELISKEATASRTLSIWSAGCSTGEEPYSLAILLRKLIPRLETWNIHIHASDLDETALQVARKGEYGQWSFRGVNTDIINDCFIKEGDKYKIKEKYKSLVQFTANNLVLDSPPGSGDQKKKFDLIICRNVTIYFEKETTVMLASKFYNALQMGGYLIVGHAEHSAENYALFKTRAFPDAIVYQKGEGKRPLDGDIPLQLSFLPLKDNKRKISRPQAKASHKRPGIREENSLVKLIKERKAPGLSQSDNLALREHRNTSSEETKIFNEAIRYYDEKNYELAIDDFLRILDINSSNARACWMLSHIASNRGYLEEAIAWANRCVEIDPLFKESYYTLSLVHLAQGELKEAENKIKKAIYIDHDFILGYFVLGSIYILMKLQSKANKHFKMASDMLHSKPTNEIIFQTEHLTVGELLNLIELKIRKT